MPIPRERLRLTTEDREELLATARTLHCATVRDGVPHVVPLWFVWDGSAIWVNSLRRSRRGRDLADGSPVALCIDTGTEYAELRGLTAQGTLERVEDENVLAPIRAEFGRKYWHGVDVPNLRSHEWLRFRPASEATWDFRRIAEAGRDPRLDALETRTDS